MTGILNGIRVLDFGRYIAAPYCCQLLADMGAEVIRVERPGGEVDRDRGPIAENGQSIYFVALNRNKKAITLNLASERGRQLLLEIVRHVDVLVHNQPATRLQALGLDYARLAAANPKLIYLGVSGFGSTGPYARNTAFDAIVQAMCGAAHMSGLPGGPPILSHIPYIDFGTSLYGALAVSLALFHRVQTGRGQSIDLALFGTGLSFVGAYSVFAEASLNGLVRRSMGNNMIYGVGAIYPCRDGRIAICCFGDPLWRRLCETIGRADMLKDERLCNDVARYRHKMVVDEAVSAWSSPRTVEAALEVLHKAGVPADEVLAPDRAMHHPQAQALEMVQMIDQPGLGNVPVAGTPMKFSEAAGAIHRPAPQIGEHNAEFYDALFGAGASRRLADEGAI